jgi:hypothetical protein
MMLEDIAGHTLQHAYHGLPRNPLRDDLIDGQALVNMRPQDTVRLLIRMPKLFLVCLAFSQAGRWRLLDDWKWGY